MTACTHSLNRPLDCQTWNRINCISWVQLISHVWLFVTPWTAACRASLSITNSLSLLKLMSLSQWCHPNHLIIFHPLLFLPSIFPTIRVFCKESVPRIRWPKDCCFSISPYNEYPGLTSFRIDWFDLLAVQGTLKNLLQHRRSKASILRCSTLFRAQQKVTLYSPTNLLDGFWTTLHLS